MSGRRRLKTLKLRRHLSLRKETLLGRFDLCRFLSAADDHFVLFLIFFEESRFSLYGERSNFHLDSVLLDGLFHLLQMLIIAVLSEPGDDIAFGPVDFEGVRVFVVDMVL